MTPTAVAPPPPIEHTSTGYRWSEIAQSEDFRALVAARRRFVARSLVIWMAIFWTYTLLAVYADGVMGASVYGAVKAGYAAILAVGAAALAMPWLYSRYATRVLDPLAERVRNAAEARP
jgi:uncharacterized membrane protein (DUF485 family)